MAPLKWYFPEDTSVTIWGINGLKFDSHASNIKTIVREFCQNSCDAARYSDKPVRMEFERFTISGDQIPDCEGIKTTIQRCINTIVKMGGTPSQEAIFKEMLDSLDEPIAVLRVSDFGTTGAFGSDDSSFKVTPWKSMTVGKGFSSKSGNSGGSFGRGKESFYAVSNLHMLFYSTYDINGISASLGCCELLTHYDGNKKYNSFGVCGNYLNAPSCTVYDQLTFGNYNRTPGETGTDVFVIGYDEEESDWEDMILISIIEEFFIKIVEGNLVVKVGNKELSKNNIDEMIDLYAQTKTQETFDLLMVKEQLTIYRQEPMYEDKICKLYLAHSENYRSISSIRSGMVISKEFRTCPNVVGLLVVTDAKTSELLCKCEPSAHDKWNISKISNATNPEKKQIREIVNDFSDLVQYYIDQLRGYSDTDSLDAEGIDKYLSMNDTTGDVVNITKKEYAWNPISEVKSKKKKRKPVKEPEPQSYAEPEELLSSESLPDEDFTPTGALDQSERERDNEDVRNFTPDENGDMKRRFVTSSNIKMSAVLPVCSKSQNGVECVLNFNINRNDPYYIRINAIMSDDKISEAIPLISVQDESGNSIPIVDGITAGPIVSLNGSRNRLKIILDYPSVCNICSEVMEYAD